MGEGVTITFNLDADYEVVRTQYMIGRNRDDKPEEANTVYLVGSDRISTELHNIGEDANAGLPTPLTLDYEMNDPADPEGIYYRSDHYSYAAKGIPIIFRGRGRARRASCPRASRAGGYQPQQSVL